ncbi:hypothetical protein JTB14_011495 [Gonioctena quinquepunctata]|nr:hypothetical protein JTB14_011495 [Gonioctena quinquepunctata]
MGNHLNCPVKIEFVSNLLKKHVLENGKKLKVTNISISHEDLKILKKHLHLHRQDDTKRSYIRGNKLIVNGKHYSVEQLVEIDQHKEEENNTKSAPATPIQYFREPNAQCCMGSASE